MKKQEPWRKHDTGSGTIWKFNNNLVASHLVKDKINSYKMAQHIGSRTILELKYYYISYIIRDYTTRALTKPQKPR